MPRRPLTILSDRLTRTVVGVLCKDGVLLGADKLMFSKLQVPGTNRRIYNIDYSLGAVISGKVPDGRALVGHCRKEALKYSNSFDLPMAGRIMAERLGLFVNAHTLYGSVRPFGASVILASYSPE
jgi:20S proteasome subunit alpha 7